MNINTTIQNDTTHLTIQGNLSIMHVSELKSALLDITPAPSGIRIDLTTVTEIDMAGIQVLCSANLYFESRAIPLKQSGKTTPLFQEALIETGFEANGNCPETPCNHCFWKGD